MRDHVDARANNTTVSKRHAFGLLYTGWGEIKISLKNARIEHATTRPEKTAESI